MPKLRVRALVPGSPDRVYEHVTGFPVSGQVDDNTLEARYGRLLQRDNNELTFWEDVGGGVTWKCIFEPPNRRTMRAVDSSWSDRIDQFAPSGNSTLWTITWELKAQGLASYTQWLAFQLREKKRVYLGVVGPVVSHFQGTASDI